MSPRPTVGHFSDTHTSILYKSSPLSSGLHAFPEPNSSHSCLQPAGSSRRASHNVALNTLTNVAFYPQMRPWGYSPSLSSFLLYFPSTHISLSSLQSHSYISTLNRWKLPVSKSSKCSQVRNPLHFYPKSLVVTSFSLAQIRCLSLLSSCPLPHPNPSPSLITLPSTASCLLSHRPHPSYWPQTFT